jgi:hypothetical protein
LRQGPDAALFIFMAPNLQRSTPGRLLVLWAALMTGVLIFSWRVHLDRADYDWCDYPTALGDRDYYKALSDNDFYTPSLKFSGHSEGLCRRTVKPVASEDSRMTKLARDATNRVFVYVDARKPGRFFVKTGEDRYVEFGARKFWPEYKAPTAAPPKK